MKKNLRVFFSGFVLLMQLVSVLVGWQAVSGATASDTVAAAAEVTAAEWQFKWASVDKNDAGLVPIDGNATEYKLRFTTNVKSIANLKIDLTSPMSKAAYVQRFPKIVKDGSGYYVLFSPISYKAGEYAFAPVFKNTQYKAKGLKVMFERAAVKTETVPATESEANTETPEAKMTDAPITEPKTTETVTTKTVTTTQPADAVAEPKAEVMTTQQKIDAIVGDAVKLDADCIAAGITEKVECDKLLVSKNLPEVCVKAKAGTQAECQTVILREKIITDCESGNETDCGKSISGAEVQTRWQKTIQENAVISTSTETKAPAQANLGQTDKALNVQCAAAGFSTVSDCAKYLALNSDCRGMGMKTESECRETVFQLIGKRMCLAAGVVSADAECRAYLFNKYSAKTECRGTDELVCAMVLENKQLENVVIKQKKFEKLAEVQNGDAKPLNIADLKESLGWASDIVTIKNETVAITILKTKNKIVVKDDKTLVQTAPAAIALDADGDGLPDDIEKKLKTDPNNADTDGDTFSDLAELKNGYNPNGEGKIKLAALAPIHRAIIAGLALEHPETEGTESEKMTIEEVKMGASSTTGYILNGKAEPSSTVTLYTYSDMPMVVTVDTDELGNWMYEFSNPLTDGEHSVYVAMNDSQGKITEKSRPFSFFIREARAVTQSEYIGSGNAKKTMPILAQPNESNLLVYYIVALLVFLVVGIGLFLYIIKRRGGSAGSV